MIYLDNNATTIMPLEVQKSLMRWSNMGNPSAGYASAKSARAMMQEMREYIGELCGIKTCCFARIADPPTDLDYKIIFTSGASEANCTLLASTVDAYFETTRKIPHIVMSALEHKSLYLMALNYSSRNKATVTFVAPNATGHITAQDVDAAILPNTCIVCVMHANNETGAINDIEAISAVAHARRVPFHCDTVQTFGKFRLHGTCVDSFCISFHKFGGPPGIGALIIKQKFILGYKLQPAIFGTQNEGWRGGTENLPGIGASFTALRLAMVDRPAKNAHLDKMKYHIMTEIAAAWQTVQYADYRASERPCIVFLSAHNSLPNTILLSIVDKNICNSEIKSLLESAGIIVSIGSACNTSSEKASHILYAMGADEKIRAGALRISLSDDTTMAQCTKFTCELLTIIGRKK